MMNMHIVDLYFNECTHLCITSKPSPVQVHSVSTKHILYRWSTVGFHPVIYWKMNKIEISEWTKMSSQHFSNCNIMLEENHFKYFLAMWEHVKIWGGGVLGRGAMIHLIMIQYELRHMVHVIFDEWMWDQLSISNTVYWCFIINTRGYVQWKTEMSDR